MISDKYIGIPFETFDCYRLVVNVFKQELDVHLDMFETIGTKEGKRIYMNFLKEISTNWEEVSKDDLQNFDVVAMTYDVKHPNIVQHLGVLLDGKVLHTLKGKNAHLTKLSDPYLSGKIKGFYRWKSLTKKIS